MSSILTSTVKNDPDWEDQIEIKYENISEYIDEYKEDAADCREFQIKIEKCSADEELEDSPQVCTKGVTDVIEGDYEHFNCSDDKGLDVGSKNALECQGSKIHKCLYCNYESPLLARLKSHVNFKHTRKTIVHTCKYCDYKSPYSSSLKSHINCKHTREVIHKCQYCDYESPYNSALRSHINSKHTRENIYTCQYCDYEYPYSSALKSHINSKHTRENIHKCEYCDYESPYSSALKSHTKRKHREVKREDI